MARTSSHRVLIRKEIHAILLAAFLLVLTASPVYSASLRFRRQTASRYTVNTLAVVDDRMYSWFSSWLSNSTWARADLQAKLKEYVSLVVHQMNVRLNNTGGLPLLKLVQMKINESVVTGDSSGVVDANTALSNFTGWLKANEQSGKYDHSILFSGYVFASQVQGGEIKGRAYIGRMCDTTGYSASVVQESGGFESAHYAAHEVGHNLGSNHDGEGNSINCSPADRFIMAPTRDGNGTAQNLANPWYFSPCSTSVITSSLGTFKSSSPNCFRPDVAPMQEFTNTFSSAAGQLYPADVQCQMMYGQKSRVCLGPQFSNLSDICTSMFCLLLNGQGCSGHFAAEGTTCGNKKWCRSGRCVSSSSAPAISDNCPNGDSVVMVNGKQCSDYVSANAWVCYNQTIRETVCCSSCAAARRNTAGCEFGDRYSGCAAAKNANPSCVSIKNDCCATCGNGQVRHLLHWTSAPLAVVLTLWVIHHGWGNGFI